MDHWDVSVESIDIRQTVEDTRNFVTFEMPPGDQLLLTTVRFKNSGDIGHTVPPGDRFAALINGQRYTPVDTFPHPARDGEFDLQWSQYASESNNSYLPPSNPGPEIRPDVTVGLWFGTVIPDGVGPGSFRIGFDRYDTGRYPYRWETR